MIEILVDSTNAEGLAPIGAFVPSEVPAVLSLLEKYGVMDENGATGVVSRIIYDVGFRPSVCVSVDYGE